MDESIDLDDYSDIALVAIMLIGTSEDHNIDHVTRIHKMAFLADKIIGDSDLDDDFDFDAHYFGPFSENLEDSLTKLKSWGIIRKSNASSKGSSLTDVGEKLLTMASEKYNGIYTLCCQLNNDLKNLSTDEIIKIVYRLYPNYTTESIIKDNLVKTNNVDSFSIPPQGNGSTNITSENGAIYSINYDGDTITIEEVEK
jgi:uncharacterized protein YwgA